MTAATDGRLLLNAVIDNPDDDAVRLVYADWLEEEGDGIADASRAEFIRCQIEVARTGQFDCRQRELWEGTAGVGGRLIRCGRCAFCRPMRRAWQIHKETSRDLIGEMPFDYAHTTEHYSTDPDHDREHFTLYLWRGFVDVARCPLDAWRRHGPAVAKAHPTSRVELTDRRPADFSNTGDTDPWSWWTEAEEGWSPGEQLIGALLPRPLWELLTGHGDEGMHFKPYRQRDAAIDAASAALILWARAQPGDA